MSALPSLKTAADELITNVLIPVIAPAALPDADVSNDMPPSAPIRILEAAPSTI